MKRKERKETKGRKRKEGNETKETKRRWLFFTEFARPQNLFVLSPTPKKLEEPGRRHRSTRGAGKRGKGSGKHRSTRGSGKRENGKR